MGTVSEVEEVLNAIETRYKGESMISVQDVLEFVRGLLPKKIDAGEIEKIFDYWKTKMESPRSVLDKNRVNLIKKALKSYTPADICQAIRGCSKTPHNMGMNDQGRKYNGLDLILRNAEKIDQFIALDNAQPRAKAESVEVRNARAIAMLDGVLISDGNTLEMQ